ncbi:hypothetical protein [Paenibacillus aceti]|uniref:Uncharacterized protein n=1 Tax=Paenibacillus aceti TaxID=1820010 RepID=A0ABQ1VPA5_9BACL|nr:hypothetical protein [Paenibacillus aceti]GGF86356.1 hypothetical protein GCM10010913_04780 [Paenibacillus aceti]
MENVSIYDVIRSLSIKRKVYVKWRFNLWRQLDKVPANEEELLLKMKVKSLDSFREWENSEQFKHITSLVLQMNQGKDLEEIYIKVKERVNNDPQPKDVELMLKLQKEINEHYREAQKYFQGE